MSGPKVVELRQEGWRDGITALKQIIADLESGELEPIQSGVLVLMGKDGGIETFAFGPRGDDVTSLGLLRIGERIIVDSALEEEWWQSTTPLPFRSASPGGSSGIWRA